MSCKTLERAYDRRIWFPSKFWFCVGNVAACVTHVLGFLVSCDIYQVIRWSRYRVDFASKGIFNPLHKLLK